MRRVSWIVVTSTLLLAGGVVPRATSAKPRPKATSPEHVVLVLLGGGVTPEEMRDPERMPALARRAKEGALLELRAHARRPHAGASATLTARRAPDLPGHPRPAHATVMEVVRRAHDLAPEQVFFVMADEASASLSPSTDPAHGPAVGPRAVGGGGAFGTPLAPLLDRLGRPLPTEPAAWSLLADLRRRSREAAGPWLPEGVDAATPEAERIERALLLELDRKTLLQRGPVAKDARAVRAAGTALRVHRPALLVLRLGDLAAALDEGERRTRLAAEDELLARLVRVVEEDGTLGGRTAFVLVGEPHASPRDTSGDAVRAPGHAATSPPTVGFLAWGPGLRRARKSPAAPALVDVAPTVARLFGATMPEAEGRVLEEVLR